MVLYYTMKRSVSKRTLSKRTLSKRTLSKRKGGKKTKSMRRRQIMGGEGDLETAVKALKLLPENENVSDEVVISNALVNDKPPTPDQQTIRTLVSNYNIMGRVRNSNNIPKVLSQYLTYLKNNTRITDNKVSFDLFFSTHF